MSRMGGKRRFCGLTMWAECWQMTLHGVPNAKHEGLKREWGRVDRSRHLILNRPRDCKR